jgi:hypothetical protein
VWDNGADAVATLRHEMEVRRIGLKNFGMNNISTGQPLSALEAKLLPLYLHHRYQLVAAAKSVGGLYFTYAVKTANGPSPAKFREIVPAARQRQALEAILDTIKVEELAVPQHIIELIPPVATGFEGGAVEYFSRRTDPAFDPIAAATIAADLVYSALLDSRRAERLNQFHAIDQKNPDFLEVVGKLTNRVFWFQPKIEAQNYYHLEIVIALQGLLVTRLMELASDGNASQKVRSVATHSLRHLNSEIKLKKYEIAVEFETHRRQMQEDIERFLNRPDAVRQATRPLPAPPGDPIGGRQ